MLLVEKIIIWIIFIQAKMFHKFLNYIILKYVVFVAPITEIKTNYYIIYDEDHENNELKNSLINYLKEQKITFNAGKGMNIIKEKKRIIN